MREPGLPQSRSRRHGLLRRIGLALTVFAILVIPALQLAETGHATPTASGADPAFPLNHTFDADIQLVGATPSNHDFEEPGTEVGTPADNHDLEDAAAAAGTPPANHDFENGTLSDWTTGGTVTLQSDATYGYYARLGATGSTVTTDAFTVSAAVQTIRYNINFLSSSGGHYLKVYVLSDSTFSTSTEVALHTCSACGSWRTYNTNISQFAGETIKVRFERTVSSNHVGVDSVIPETVFPGHTIAGSVTPQSESGNKFAALDSSGAFITTSPVLVESDAQFMTVRLTGLSTATDQYYVYVRSGTGFATSTTVAFGTIADAWSEVRWNVSAWQGEQIQVRVARQNGRVGVDNIGVQRVDFADWAVTKNPLPLTDVDHGQFVRTDGNLVSEPFTISSDAQQLSYWHRKGSTSGIYYLELLRGSTFSTVTDIGAGPIYPGDNWAEHAVAIDAYAGETVRLRLRQWFGWIDVNDFAVPVDAVPGWDVLTSVAVGTGSDAGGTYVTPFKASNSVILRSEDIGTGLIDVSGVQQKYYSLSYQFAAMTNSTVRVWWYNNTGQNWVVHQDISSSASDVVTKYFWLADFMGETGHFRVQVANGAKLYSIADNIARRQVQEPFAHKVGYGIDTSTGTFGHQELDLATAGRVPLTLRRFYTLQSAHAGPLGYRWSHNYETKLEFASLGNTGVVFGSGGEEFFTWHSSSGTFTADDARTRGKLVKHGGGTYTYTSATNLDFHFDAAGVLTAIEDLNSNVTALDYDTNGQLETVTDPDGREMTFTYDGSGRLVRVAEPSGGEVEYVYDSAGDLVTVIDPLDEERTYVYDRHRLIEAYDQDDNLVFANTLDSVSRVVAQTDALSNTITIDYDTPAKGVTSVTDPLSQTALYYFDRYQRTTDKVDPLGGTLTYIYDADGNLTRIVDPLFDEWDFGFDASGNLVSTLDPLGNDVAISYNAQRLPTSVTDARGNTTLFTYDANGNLATKTDPLSKVTTYVHDSAGRLTSVTDPLNNVESYTYDGNGNLATRTDPNGKVWTYTYDAAGRKISETNPLSQTTTWLYDLAGRLIFEEDALGNERLWLYAPTGHLVLDEDQMGRETQWFYDARGLPERMRDAAGLDWLYAYDANRRLVSETDPLGNITAYTYDDAGRVETVTDPEGGVTTYAYDDAGRVVSEEDPLNRESTYAYDAAGRLASMILPNTGTWTYSYDENGNLLVETNPLSQSTTYLYDDLDRLTRVTDPLLRQTNFVYDDAGRLVEEIDALSQSTDYVYDAAGRMTSVTNPLNETTTYAYDDAGRRTSVTDPLSRTTAYAFDAAGRLSSITDSSSNTTSFTYDPVGRRTSVTYPGSGVTSYAYDVRGLLTSVTDPLSNVTTYTYDDARRRTTMVDARGSTTTYTRDDAGRQVELEDELGETIAFAYDAAGQRTSVTNANGKTTTYAYDAVGNLLTSTDPLNRTTTYTYDLAGRMTSEIDARSVTMSYSYDAAGQLTGMTFPGGSATYDYDDLGRRIEMLDGTGLTTWTYDAASRVTAVASPQGTLGYTYNAAGQRSAMTLPGSRTLTYAYDSGGRLDSVTDWASRTISFDYDVNGNRTLIKRPNGVDSTYSYDAANRLAAIVHADSGGTIESFSYTLDAVGNRTAVTSSAGTESYTLDALNRITAVTYPGGPTVSYTYDANGNRTVKNVSGGATTNYTYDDAGQLTFDGATTYTYDDAGNLVSRGSDSFTWDHVGRLASATVGGVTTTYTYDADGTRVSKSVSGTPVDYLWDAEAGLPLLVDDGTSAFVHAGGILSEVDSSSASYHLADGLGSVRGMTDLSGSVIGAADYEIFGQVTASSGTGSVFGFTGEQFDVETGFTFLRARYHDPSLGRFISADSVQPNAPGSQGWNLYSYVANNPTTWVDPSGHVAVAAVPAGQLVLYAATGACLAMEWCRDPMVLALHQMASDIDLSRLSGSLQRVFLVVACILNAQCRDLALSHANVIQLNTPWNIDEGDVTVPPVPPLPPIPSNWPDVGNGGPNNPFDKCTNPDPKPWGERNPKQSDFSDPELKRTWEQIYRPKDRMAGGPAGAVRAELISEGKASYGHLTKLEQRYRQLKTHYDSGRLSAVDKEFLEWVLIDFAMALECAGRPKL